jgi:hypothetical protein
MRVPHPRKPRQSLEPCDLLTTISGRRAPYEDDTARGEIQMSRPGVERQKAIGEKCHNERERRAVTVATARRHPSLPLRADPQKPA